MKAHPDYERTCNMTHRLVGRFKDRCPLFAFPDREVALIASVADIGEKLARNDAARELVAKLLSETKVLGLPDYPTTLMLLVCLEDHCIPIQRVEFHELGLEGTVIRRQPPS
jgi:hypothetical protein